jgi:hypothetical protein
MRFTSLVIVWAEKPVEMIMPKLRAVKGKRRAGDRRAESVSRAAVSAR